MADRNTCRLPSCENEPRGREPGVDTFAARFCSTGCELKYEHLRDDARDAERAAQEGRL